MKKEINHHGICNLLGLKSISDRTIVYIWMTLNPNPTYYSNTDPLEMDLSIMEHLLKSQPLIQSIIIENLSKSIIAEHELDWITDTERQFNWIESNISRFFSNFQRPPTSLLKKLPFRLRSIGLFDYKSLNSKANEYQTLNASELMRMEWSQQTKRDRRFLWANLSEDSRERYYLWDYLEKYNPALTNGKNPFQTHNDLLKFFDELYLNRSVDIETLNKQAQKAWKQKQRRSDPLKQQCNFELNSSTLDKLEIISRKHGSSRTAIIEILINSEFASEHHITNHLKNRLN